MSHTMVPPPISEVYSFDWNSLLESHLSSYIPFHIIVEVLSKQIFRSTIEEGLSISILSSTAREVMGSPSLVSVDDWISTFNRIPSQPLGILP